MASGSVTIDGRLYTNGAVNLILEDGCDLTVNKVVCVLSGGSLTIYAQSTVGEMGKLTVLAENEMWVAGIGGGLSSVTINGGIITATGGPCSAGIGNGSSSSGASFFTGTNRNPVIFSSSISDNDDTRDWSGVFFEGVGEVYGSPLSHGLPIPAGTSLMLDMNGHSLTFADGTGIPLGSGSSLTLSGPGTFSDGISVTGGTLEDLLPVGWAYTQNGKCVPVSGLTVLSGEINLSKISVTITSQPADVTMTYGKTKSLSALGAGSHQIYCAVTC